MKKRKLSVRRKIISFFIFLLFLNYLVKVPCSGQLSERREFKIKRISSSPQIDGLLNDPCWQGASRTGNFVQLEPNKGEEATEKTEVFAAYDDQFLYIAFYCYDSFPEKIVAKITQRDQALDRDDMVQVFLDTYCDRRTGYFFFTNPLGTQADGKISDDGRVSDHSWDEYWLSAAQIVEDGWTAEIAIPFEILKYRKGKDQIWGVNFGRNLPRKLEKSLWSEVESWFRVSQYGNLTGLDLEKGAKKYGIVPYLMGRFEEEKLPEKEFGMDIRYSLTSNLSANITINPDFATVETDEEQVNLTRFELHLPEKRQFFQEGLELFRTRINSFYTRRISDIKYGIKLFGKLGAFNLAFLNAQTYPMEDNPETEKDESMESANYSALRLKKDIFKSSTIGFTLANRLIKGQNTGSINFDLTHYFSRTVRLTGQYVQSWSPEIKSKAYGYFLRLARDTSTTHYHLRFTELGENFADNVNATGFVVDDDRLELDSNVSHRVWIKKGIEYIQWRSNYNIYWGHNKTLRSKNIFQSLSAELKNKFSFGLDYVYDYKLYEKSFQNNLYGIRIGYNTREWENIEIYYRWGRNFDTYVHFYQIKAAKKITEKFSLEYQLTRLNEDPDIYQKSTWINILKSNYYFT
ncbi:MAG: DUF5916 domain-containing protein [Candidatus Aminicenantia bacterium]